MRGIGHSVGMVAHPGEHDEPVTVTVARHVAHGREEEFEQWLDGILGTASRFPGYLGGGAMRPGKLGDEWHVIYRFETADCLHDWEVSDERRRWLEKGEDLVDEVAISRISGLETWFSLPGRTAPAPPRWKMFLVTLCAIVPLVFLMNLLIQPHIKAWPLIARSLVFSGTLTGLMTWVVMPRMTRLFRRWLYPPRQSDQITPD
jgi:uncharacterized protein